MTLDAEGYLFKGDTWGFTGELRNMWLHASLVRVYALSTEYRDSEEAALVGDAAR
jgi:hypothetical protein